MNRVISRNRRYRPISGLGMSLAELNSNCSSRLRLLVFAHTDMAKRMAFFVCGVVTRMVKKIERVGKTSLPASTSLFGLPSPPSRLGRNLSDCQRQISQKRTSRQVGDPTPDERRSLLQAPRRKIAGDVEDQLGEPRRISIDLSVGGGHDRHVV